jgi:raffinose/stachyose/melibiose transport system substrate-binding protein
MPSMLSLRNALLIALITTGTAQAGTLTIESWRVDDKEIWQRSLIPAFKRAYPGIEVKFSPTAPTEYDSSLTARLAGGTAGDIVACRPFDVSLSLYKKGQLDKLDGKVDMKDFSASAKAAWQTDDGKETYCMPVASVIHGFLYNKKIFTELKLQPPTTEAELFKVMDAIKKNGKYMPLALGTADQWESNQIIFTSIGPNYWKGEEGRKALIDGKAKFTDPQFVAAFDYEAKLGTYMPKGASAQTYGDSQNLFALGKAAIFPAGSWDVAYFNQRIDFEMGAFPPPVKKAGDKCYISDHNDIGFGINKNSKNKEDAYKFMAWLASPDFADRYTDRVAGFFSLSNHPLKTKNSVARQMIEWRSTCSSTIRVNAQFLNRGEPSMENQLWNVNAQVLNGKLSGKEAAAKIQSGFEKSYKPQQK